MKTTFIGILLAALTLTFSPVAKSAGFKQIRVHDSGEADLTVGVWYPSDVQAPAEPNTEYGMAVALNAPVSRSNETLILISHGYSGWYAGHADTAIALADAGYIVAAPSHAGNTWSDMSSPLAKWVLDRPRHITRVIDHMLDHEPVARNVNPDNIGLYGFSAGGYTALSLIGGVPDLDLAHQHCLDYPREFVCAEGMIDAMFDAKMNELSADAWGTDKRIQAAVIAAPGFGFAYPRSALTTIKAKVQLWSALLDESVPHETNSAFLARQLPITPETHWVENANHFAFMTVPCTESFKDSDPAEYEVVCVDSTGFDRYVFHNNMHKEMIRFFKKSLTAGSESR